MKKPKHIAIIMDGNGRWAQERGLKRSEGHLAGAQTVRTVLTECVRHEIPHVSLYAFSTENWNRPQEEVNYLFTLFCEFTNKELPLMLKEGIRLNVIGEKSNLPLATRKALDYAIKKTAKGTNTELTLALNYSGSQEIIQAARKSAYESLCSPENLERIIKAAQNEATLKKEFARIFSETDYTEANLRKHFFYPELPDPDLIIRTSGELRLSNFYLFQAAYSELYFTDVYWPDFSALDFKLALDVYANRKRRFGKIDV